MGTKSGIRVQAMPLLSSYVLLMGAVACTQAQWQMQTSNTTADLRGIHNVGGGVAWASGTNGTVLRTEDGGYLWQTCSIPPGAIPGSTCKILMVRGPSQEGQKSVWASSPA